MEHFLIVTNRQKDSDFSYTRKITEYLESRGKTCLVESGMKDRNFRIPQETECVIVLGGDGTVLRAARAASAAGIPIIGVNLGTLGYLTEVDRENLETALERLISGEFTKEKRMMLSGRLLPFKNSKGRKEKEPAFALNDIAITRKGSLQVITFHIYVNGQFLQTCHADGILISTPTGSTGYNLSAGGPIVEPQAQLILLTPICPHTLHARTIVLSAQDSIIIEIGENKNGTEQEVEACFDGSGAFPLNTGDRMEIVRAEKTTEFVKLSQASFLEVLRKKMEAE